MKRNWFFSIVCLIILIVSGCGSISEKEPPENGYEFILEGSPYQFILTKCNFINIIDFRESLDEAQYDFIQSGGVLFDIWLKKYENKNPSQPLARVFSYYDDNYSPELSNAETINKLKQEYDGALTSSGLILKNRLKQFGAAKIDVEMINPGQLKLSFYCDADKAHIRKILSVFARIGFFETFESHNGIELLSRIDAKRHERDSLSSINQLDFDTIKEDYAQSGFNSQNKLMRKIRINYEVDGYGHYNYSPGALVGYVFPEDTAVVNMMLKDSLAEKNIPADMKFVWGMKSADVNGNWMESLYVIKARSLHLPAMESDCILSASVNRDENTGGFEISVLLTYDGSQKFEEMTRNNLNRSIAILLEDKVISAPIVQGVISGSELIISGNFTNQEAEELVMLLSAGMLPMQLKIVDEKTLK